MADNMVLILKQGESGASFIATLKSANPTTGVLEATDLTNFATVDIVARKTLTADPVLDEACTISGPSTGTVEYEFDDTTSDIPGSKNGLDYLLEFKGTDASGDFHYWPKNKDGRRTYGTLRVFAPLS